jgi:hypothetical protein
MTTSFSRPLKPETMDQVTVQEERSVGRKVCAVSRRNNYVWPRAARQPHVYAEPLGEG